jgi:adenosylcobinamide-GDP ribazoletransferase
MPPGLLTRALEIARPLAAAVAFLTRVPVAARLTQGEMARGAMLFPLVGAALGLLVGGAAVLLADALPPVAAASLAVALEAVLTGALHLDGLADSVDGLAAREREQALAIMHDPALGAYGGSALTLELVAKVAALSDLVEGQEVGLVAAAYAVSRAAPLPLAAALPYARAGEGTGRLLAERLSARRALAGLLLAAALAGAAAGAWAAAGLVCLLAVDGIVGLTARSRLGGVTGDVMGAAIELTAALALAVAAGWRG